MTDEQPKPYDDTALALRLDAIEARQRANEQHDPDCPFLLREKAQRRTDIYLMPQACSCWLTNKDTDNA